MKPTDPVSIVDALTQFFSSRHINQGLMEGRALELWSEVAGEYISAATEDAYIRNGVIYIHFSSPSVRVDVMTRRNFLVSELNRALGGRFIRNIVLR